MDNNSICFDCLGFNVAFKHLRSYTLTNLLPHRNVMSPHRNAMSQTQGMTPHPVTDYRHMINLPLRYPLMWNVTLEYTTIHFNVMGQTRSGNTSPTFQTPANAQLNDASMVEVNETLGRKYTVYPSPEPGTCGVRIYYAIRSPTAVSQLFELNCVKYTLWTAP